MNSTFDPRHVRRAFARAASSYAAAAALQREVETRLLESLDYLGDTAPKVVLEATHARALDIIPLELLRAHAADAQN